MIYRNIKGNPGRRSNRKNVISILLTTISSDDIVIILRLNFIVTAAGFVSITGCGKSKQFTVEISAASCLHKYLESSHYKV